MNRRNMLLCCLMVLVITSTSMLAISIEHLHLIPFTAVIVILSLIVTEWKKWFSMDGWIANIVSVVVLLLTMQNFFSVNSAEKLIAVGNLLVYLQAVLLFQKVTVRLTWQIMVLCLLQIVVTTIFSIGFEGSLLFAVFFVFGGMALFLQNSLANRQLIEKSNTFAAVSLNKQQSNRQTDARQPIATFDFPEHMEKFSWRQLVVLPALLLVATVFTVILFLTAPRQIQPWYSPISYKVSATAMSKSVDPYETGKIENSEQRLMRASFRNQMGNQVQFSSPPYFRALALSSLVIKNDRTTFEAPHERIFSEHYQNLPVIKSSSKERVVQVEFEVEPNSDPVVHTVSPSYMSEGTPRTVQFCHEISALTRCRQNQQIEFAPFGYQLSTIVDERNSPLGYWPYLPNSGRLALTSMEEWSAQFAWLTHLERQRYPKLVEMADRIADRVRQSGGGRLELVRAFEDHFLNPIRYQYTLDYSDIQRRDGIDPIEDFAANFRKGHCEVFAAAMTLMLRSQNVPARMVVGFHGGDYNELSKSYYLRGRHAHAWVEVYLRPEDCTEKMKSTVPCELTGVWLTADPTPPQPAEAGSIGTEDAIDLARSVWQDYVLGMESEKKEGPATLTSSLALLIEKFELENLPESIEQMRKPNAWRSSRPFLIGSVILLVLVGIGRQLWRARFRKGGKKPAATLGSIRRMLAHAVGLVSSDLRDWIIGDSPETLFYKRLVDALKKHGYQRSPQQTHLEFADEISVHLASHPDADKISQGLRGVTQAFNRIRFGGSDLKPEQRARLDAEVSQLVSLLKVSA